MPITHTNKHGIVERVEETVKIYPYLHVNIATYADAQSHIGPVAPFDVGAAAHKLITAYLNGPFKTELRAANDTHNAIAKVDSLGNKERKAREEVRKAAQALTEAQKRLNDTLKDSKKTYESDFTYRG